MPVAQNAAAQAGAKRKRASGLKFYAVRAGHNPGIYQSWDECLGQVRGFKGAQFKSFPTSTEAEKFVAGEDTGTVGGTAATPPKFYAVKRGRVPGIYTDWPSAQKQITGWTKPVYRAFPTRAEAERFQKGETNSDEHSPSQVDTSGTARALVVEDEPSAKKQKGGYLGEALSQRGSRPAATESIIDGYEPGLQLPTGAEDGFDTNIILKKGASDVIFKSKRQREATKLKATGLSEKSALRIFTDGSSLGNGQKGAFAGVGVYFGPLDSRNISEALPGVRQTNQRAELTAIVRALDTAPKDRDITIVTDSDYAINCSTKWYQSWKNHGWRTAAGKTVENRDIVENIASKIEEREALSSITKFEWVKAHANFPGNVEADRLAIEGARKASQASME